MGNMELSPISVHWLLMLLLVSQLSIAPLAAEVRLDPACSYFLFFLSNSCLRAQAKFPWYARHRQTACIYKWMHCLPGHASALTQHVLSCYVGVNVWLKNFTLKGNSLWYLPLSILSVYSKRYINSSHILLDWYILLLVLIYFKEREGKGGEVSATYGNDDNVSVNVYMACKHKKSNHAGD